MSPINVVQRRIPPRAWVIALLTVSISLYILYSTGLGSQFEDGCISSIQNSTLGFAATILISLPERTDRRDAISLLTSVSNITITHHVNAVRGESISHKAKPFGKAGEEIDAAHLGSWRSHMDALKYVVDNRLETALIFEDDVDWDKSLKQQLKDFAQGLRSSQAYQSPSSSGLERFPYGQDWDLLHLGSSRIRQAPEPHNKISTIYQDISLPTGPAEDLDCSGSSEWYCFASLLANCNVPEQSRVIVPTYDSVGLVSLAVSFEGAKRLLYMLSWRGLDQGLDNSIRDSLKNGEIHGWTVVPPIFGSWITGSGTDSDINLKTENLTVMVGNNLEGKSKGLRDSMRKRLDEVMEKETYWGRSKVA